ncbi:MULTISPECIES: hypothetical protein [Micromonospora]|uniref:YtxH-like protein n=1 Tax=Micromonospora zamorensis TaxID=709883 RepID=A0ABZ1PIE2_9ACTN|nr:MULTISPECIES: hypothetical protein [Micromonospora]MBQ0982156.1 hypothetical protein [Micromonospora sp. M61]MBQ1038348.1 hypothetical protein [Micromonospora sp. C81]WSK50532.1 hypothetical protein OG423_09270 [Micromonospora zamorensis]WTE86913.1 hypothetical protein OHA01_31170 [Micromonospora zamorensis]WTI21688.1 hypothetical protein OG886_00750 [Micromonospora zamorensis]
MRGKIMFLGGLAAGFVLGARAGREKYEELVVRGRKVLDHPTVQEAAGVAQAQANKFYSEGKDKLGQTKLGEKLGSGNGNGSTGKQELTAADDAFAGTPATVGAKAGTSTVGTTSGSPSSTNNPRTKPSGSGTNASTL